MGLFKRKPTLNEQLLHEAGFGEIRIIDRIAEFGIIYENPCSHTFIARRV